MPAPQLEVRLEKERPPAVVVVAGTERWFRHGAVEQLVAHALPDGDPGGALVRLDGRTLEDQPGVSRALDELRSASLFAPTKLVVVKNAEALTHAGKRGMPALTQLVKDAIASAPPGSLLVLATPRPVKGKSAVPAAKLAQAGAWVVDCRALYDAPGPWERGAVLHDHELSRFLARRMHRKYGKRLHLEDAHALTRTVGSELGELDGALSALALYVGDRKDVTAEDVHESIGETREDPLWRLADAVFERRVEDAIALVEAAFDRGVTDQRGNVVARAEALAPMIIATLQSSWRRILAGAEGLARGESAEAVTKDAGLPPFLSGAFSARCRRRPDDVLAMSEAFFQAEAGIKGGGVPPRLATERLVVRLASGS